MTRRGAGAVVVEHSPQIGLTAGACLERHPNTQRRAPCGGGSSHRPLSARAAQRNRLPAQSVGPARLELRRRRARRPRTSRARHSEVCRWSSPSPAGESRDLSGEVWRGPGRQSRRQRCGRRSDDGPGAPRFPSSRIRSTRTGASTAELCPRQPSARRARRIRGAFLGRS